MIGTVAPGGPGFATIGAGVRSESEMEAEVVLHIAQLRHASLTELAHVHSVCHTCLIVDDGHSDVVLGKLFLRVIVCDLISRLCGLVGEAVICQVLRS